MSMRAGAIQQHAGRLSLDDFSEEADTARDYYISDAIAPR